MASRSPARNASSSSLFFAKNIVCTLCQTKGYQLTISHGTFLVALARKAPFPLWDIKEAEQFRVL